MTVSVGVADVAEVGSDYETLHGAADVALYRAKSDGRDRVAVYRREPLPKQIATIRAELAQLMSATA